MKITLSYTYDLKRQVSGYPDYYLTECGKVINVKRKKLVKKTKRGLGIVGYFLNGVFVNENEI